MSAAEGLRAAVATLEVEGETFYVLHFDLVEAVGGVARLACSVVDEGRRAPRPGALLGREATFRLSRGAGGRREFAGVVVGAENGAGPGGRHAASLDIAAGLYRLGMRADCQAFRRQKLDAIVARLFEDAGGDVGALQWSLSREYPEREYAVQYRETGLDFVLRLLTEEGIYVVAHHDGGGERIIFTDAASGLGPVEGPSALAYRPSFGPAPSGDYVTNLGQRRRTTTDKVSVRDYDPKAPRTGLDASAESTDAGPHALEAYVYPGRFRDPGTGRRRAEALLHGLQATRDVVRGESPSLALRPGQTFSVVEHPYLAFNREYLVTSVRLRGSDPGAAGRGGAGGEGLVCGFEAVPTGMGPYRPRRRPAALALAGVQTATTAGPSGNEIHTGEHGEVKASFSWDREAPRDERSSPWARTVQVPLGGAMLLPRVGWEVSVGYDEGDPERPFVMARLYNGATMPPYGLDRVSSGALQTATTPGGGSHNELNIDDTKGREHMSFSGSKDMSVDVGNSATESVKNNYARKVGANHALNVTNSLTSSVGGAQSVRVGGAQSVRVETMMVEQVGAAHGLAIAGDRTMLVGGDHRREVGGDASAFVGSNQVDGVVGSVSESTLGGLSHKVGAALVEATATTRLVSVGGHYAESAGALKVIGTASGRDVVVSGPLTQKVGGALVASVGGDRIESASVNLTEVAGGAHIVKASNVTYEATVALSVVMGASTLTLLPAMVAVAGVSIKLDGAVKDGGALVVDN